MRRLKTALSIPAEVQAAAWEVIRLAAGATEPPWCGRKEEWRQPAAEWWAVVTQPNPQRVLPITQADADFIAACRTLAPLLARFVEGLQGAK